MSVDLSKAVSMLNNAAPLVRAVKLATEVRKRGGSGSLDAEKARKAAADVFGVDDCDVGDTSAVIDGLLSQVDTSAMGDDAKLVAETAKSIVKAVTQKDPSELPDDVLSQVDAAAKADPGTTKGVVQLIKNYRSVLGLSKDDVANFDLGG